MKSRQSQSKSVPADHVELHTSLGLAFDEHDVILLSLDKVQSWPLHACAAENARCSAGTTEKTENRNARNHARELAVHTVTHVSRNIDEFKSSLNMAAIGSQRRTMAKHQK